MAHKTCTRCHLAKPISGFHRGLGYRGGYNARCKVCRNELGIAYRKLRREQIAARQRATYYADLEKSRAKGRARMLTHRRRLGVKPLRVFATAEERIAALRAYQRVYVKRHPERRKASIQKYIVTHPEEVVAQRTNAKARARSALGTLTGNEWKAILLFYGNRCAQCGVSAETRPLSVDHFIPLSKGGTNNWRNVWPLCLPCNLIKHRKRPAAPYPPHVEVLEQTGT